MPHVLELKNGDLVTPQDVFDVLDVIEEYLGCDVRQYLEGYFWDGDELEREVVDRDEDYQRLDEHYKQVLVNIRDEVDIAFKLLASKRVERKKLTEGCGRISRMVEREL